MNEDLKKNKENPVSAVIKEFGDIFKGLGTVQYPTVEPQPSDKKPDQPEAIKPKES